MDVRKLKAFVWALAAVALLVLGTGASAVAAPAIADRPPLIYDVYMKLDGVCGEAKAEPFRNWIALGGVDFDMSFPPVDNTADREVILKKTAMKKQLTITKLFDCSSIPLMDHVGSGITDGGQIAFVTRSKDRPVTVLTIEMTHVYVTDYQFSNMFETITIEPLSINFIYTPVDGKSGGGKPNPIPGGL